jgi:hypothetical protein
METQMANERQKKMVDGNVFISVMAFSLPQ